MPELEVQIPMIALSPIVDERHAFSAAVNAPPNEQVEGHGTFVLTTAFPLGARPRADLGRCGRSLAGRFARVLAEGCRKHGAGMVNDGRPDAGTLSSLAAQQTFSCEAAGAFAV
jgi:hypothetical protein